MRRECQHICQECGNCICKRSIVNRNTGYYWCDSKTGCAAGSSYFPNGVGCSSWTPWGELQSLYDKIANDEEMKKERERMERQNREEREKLERERRTMEDENNRLRMENERLSSSSYSSLSYDSDDSYDFDDYDEDDEEVTEDSLTDQLESTTKEFTNNFKSVSKTIKEMRKEDYSNNVVDTSQLDEFMESVKDFKKILFGIDLNNYSKEFKANVKKIKSDFENHLDKFLLLFVQEIEWHYSEKHYNVAYSLANAINSYDSKSYSSLFKKCEKSFISFTLDKAKDFIEEKDYEAAIEFLKPIKDKKEAKELISECYVGAEEAKINEAKKLINASKYKEALKILEELTFVDVDSLIKECKDKINAQEINKAKGLIASKRYDEAIAILKPINTKEAKSLSQNAIYCKSLDIKNKKRKKLIITFSIIGGVILSIILAIVIGVSAYNNKQAKIVSDCQVSLVGKTFKGNGRGIGANVNYNFDRTFVFSSNTVTVTGTDTIYGETSTINTTFTYYCAWGPGNYPQYSSANDIVNIYMKSTTNNSEWRYLVSYEENGGNYFVKSFTFGSEPRYYLV